MVTVEVFWDRPLWAEFELEGGLEMVTLQLYWERDFSIHCSGLLGDRCL